MQVIVRQFGHRCDGFIGEAVPEYEGEDLRQEFKDVRRVTFPPSQSHCIKSITINKKYCITL